ncbi:MAG TPA: DNA alkylation repair protein [Anaerolineaceae bacterium]|nr:DNA alkylation repair protein [Anaerolineaceae bacterium]
MTAIDLTRLQKQIGDLVAVFSDPAVFIKTLQEILGFYERRAYRPNRQLVPKTFMRSYNLPPQVLPLIEIGLKEQAGLHPSDALALADALWQSPYYEARELAAAILGQLPADFSAQVLTRIEEWVSAPLDRAALQTLLEKASPPARLAGSWEGFIEKLLGSPIIRMQSVGLLALAIDLEQRPLSKYTGIFKLVRPFIQAGDERLEMNLSLVVKSLARRTPNESAYLLKQILADSAGSGIERRIREYLAYFPPETAAGLLEAVKTHQKIHKAD